MGHNPPISLPAAGTDAVPDHGFAAIQRGPGSPLDDTVALARRIARFDVPVLIEGEAGTGKRALARAIHEASSRANGPFVEIDCAGLPDDRLDVELFGTPMDKAGARPGLIRQAENGTLYLSGVETLSSRVQLELLRLVRDGADRGIGGLKAAKAGARLITGANGSFARRIEAGDYRADLYYALSVTTLSLPPLRGRRCDIGAIASDMLVELAHAHNKPAHGLSATAQRCLAAYDWPGNLPELRNEVTRMLIGATESVLGAELISRHILQAAPGDAHETDASDRAVMAGEGSLKTRVERIEARILRETLTRLKWNKSHAAAELGLSRVGLRAKLERYGLRPADAPALERG